jgi:hypothetical protein
VFCLIKCIMIPVYASRLNLDVLCSFVTVHLHSVTGMIECRFRCAICVLSDEVYYDTSICLQAKLDVLSFYVLCSTFYYVKSFHQQK